MATFMGAVPRILAFIAILVIGWFVATLIAKAVAALLRSIKFNQLVDQSGFTEFRQEHGAEDRRSRARPSCGIRRPATPMTFTKALSVPA